MTVQPENAVAWRPTIVLGACIGALAGLSGSPVGGTLLAALLAAATLALSVMGRFDKNHTPSSENANNSVDIRSLAVFSLAVLVATVPASLARSRILQIHSKNEIVRLLSAPPAINQIVASWKMAFPELSKKEITAIVLNKHASIEFSEDRTTSVNPSNPILLNSMETVSLADSCAILRSCEADSNHDTDYSECLRKNFSDTLDRGGKTTRNIARIIDENLSSEREKHLVFSSIALEICV